MSQISPDTSFDTTSPSLISIFAAAWASLRQWLPEFSSTQLPLFSVYGLWSWEQKMKSTPSRLDSRSSP